MFHSPDTMEPTQWLAVIHEVNRVRPKTFSRPDGIGTLTKSGAPGAPEHDGRFIEDYPEALVVMPPADVRFTDQTVLVLGKTPEVDAIIDEAARTLGFTS